MIPFRTRLQSVPNWIFVFFLLTLCQFIIRYFIFPRTSVYLGNETEFQGCVVEVLDIEYGKKITMQDQELLTGYVEEDFPVEVGDIVHVVGSLEEILEETIPNLFSYKKYARSKGQFYQLEIEKIEVVGRSLFSVSHLVRAQIEKSKASKGYLKALFLQEKNAISDSILASYQENNLMHLFAISGIHITFLLKRFSSSYGKLVILFLCFFLFYQNVSFLRTGIFSLLFLLGQKQKWCSSKVCGVLTILVLLWINPYFVEESAFWYTVVISLFLQFTKEMRRNVPFERLTTCFCIWVVSIPIQLVTSYQLNILAFLWNFLFTPIFIYLLLPLLLLTFFFPWFDFVTSFVIQLFERLSSFASTYGKINLVLGKPNGLEMAFLLFFLSLFLFSFLRKKKFSFLFFLLSFFLFFFPSSNEVIFLDVSQADATFFQSKGHYALLDSSKNKGEKLVSFLKSKGVRRLDYLFLTHGDKDHIGGSLSILENIPVGEVVFNLGPLQKLEEEVYQIAIRKSKVTRCEKHRTYSVGDFLFYSLNEERTNENDSSCVFFVTEENSNYLFLGDVSGAIENEILTNFTLPTIDYLHLAHHGSKFSTTTKMLEQLHPTYAIISAGRNNAYHHPSQETLEKLKEYQIPYFLTSEVGSIEIKPGRKRGWIKTYRPS